MRKSSAVTLILSGSLLVACKPDWSGNGGEVVYTNNTYQAGQGYWHAPYRGWYPYPYNYYNPAFGYFHGGSWSAAPDASPVRFSSPSFPGRGFGEAHGFISRGGFGSTGRGASS